MCVFLVYSISLVGFFFPINLSSVSFAVLFNLVKFASLRFDAAHFFPTTEPAPPEVGKNGYILRECRVHEE